MSIGRDNFATQIFDLKSQKSILMAQMANAKNDLLLKVNNNDELFIYATNYQHHLARSAEIQEERNIINDKIRHFRNRAYEKIIVKNISDYESDSEEEKASYTALHRGQELIKEAETTQKSMHSMLSALKAGLNNDADILASCLNLAAKLHQAKKKLAEINQGLFELSKQKKRSFIELADSVLNSTHFLINESLPLLSPVSFPDHSTEMTSSPNMTSVNSAIANPINSDSMIDAPVPGADTVTKNLALSNSNDTAVKPTVTANQVVPSSNMSIENKEDESKKRKYHEVAKDNEQSNEDNNQDTNAKIAATLIDNEGDIQLPHSSSSSTGPLVPAAVTLASLKRVAMTKIAQDQHMAPTPRVTAPSSSSSSSPAPSVRNNAVAVMSNSPSVTSNTSNIHASRQAQLKGILKTPSKSPHFMTRATVITTPSSSPSNFFAPVNLSGGAIKHVKYEGMLQYLFDFVLGRHITNLFLKNLCNVLAGSYNQFSACKKMLDKNNEVEVNLDEKNLFITTLEKFLNEMVKRDDENSHNQLAAFLTLLINTTAKLNACLKLLSLFALFELHALHPNPKWLKQVIAHVNTENFKEEAEAEFKNDRSAEGVDSKNFVNFTATAISKLMMLAFAYEINGKINERNNTYALAADKLETRLSDTIYDAINDAIHAGGDKYASQFRGSRGNAILCFYSYRMAIKIKQKINASLSLDLLLSPLTVLETLMKIDPSRKDYYQNTFKNHIKTYNIKSYLDHPNVRENHKEMIREYIEAMNEDVMSSSLSNTQMNK